MLTISILWFHFINLDAFIRSNLQIEKKFGKVNYVINLL